MWTPPFGRSCTWASAIRCEGESEALAAVGAGGGSAYAVVGDGDDERFLLDARADFDRACLVKVGVADDVADGFTDGERDAVNCLL